MTEEKKYTYAVREKETEAYIIPSREFGGVLVFKTEEDAKTDARRTAALGGRSDKELDVIVLDIEDIKNRGHIKLFDPDKHIYV